MDSVSLGDKLGEGSEGAGESDTTQYSGMGTWGMVLPRWPQKKEKRLWGKEDEVGVPYGESEAMQGGRSRGGCSAGWSSGESWVTGSANAVSAASFGSFFPSGRIDATHTIPHLSTAHTL